MGIVTETGVRSLVPLQWPVGPVPGQIDGIVHLTVDDQGCAIDGDHGTGSRLGTLTAARAQ